MCTRLFGKRNFKLVKYCEMSWSVLEHRSLECPHEGLSRAAKQIDSKSSHGQPALCTAANEVWYDKDEMGALGFQGAQGWLWHIIHEHKYNTGSTNHPKKETNEVLPAVAETLEDHVKGRRQDLDWDLLKEKVSSTCIP